MVDEGVAVFYPANFDSIRTLPSLALVKDLVSQNTLSADWKLIPIYTVENGKTVVRIPYDGQVDLYGTGEVTGPLKRNDSTVTLWNTDNYTYKLHNGKRLYQTHPWVMGVREDGTAFGIIADNTWKQYFTLSNPITITSEGPAFRIIIIEKKSPAEVLKALGDLIGTMKLPPLWALGFQQSRWSYFPDTRVKQIADEFRTRKIPCDVIWMDIDYMEGFRIFTFNAQGFPDPKGLNDYLHNKNFKAVYMIDPGVKKDTSYFVYKQGSAGNHWVQDKDGKEFNGNVWPGACAFPDFTRPETQTWWKGLYPDFMAKGIDGVWNDMNEPSVFDGTDGTMPEDNIHRGGGDLSQDSHLRYHNVYGLLMVKSSREGILETNPTKRPFVLSRANFLGGQRYAATWTGDNSSTWKSLKQSIPMSLNLSLSGQPFNGPDIGGFGGNTTAEILAHWMALGAYYPFSRNHSETGSVDQEPWLFGTKVEDVSRTAMNRRYQLLPYFYTLFREAAETGMPIMRPQFFADLKDANLRSEQQSFLLGGDLMIIPRWAENVKVPTGNWNPVKFEKTDDGYQSVVLLRPGAIVPLGTIIQSTTDYKSDSVTLLINPTADGVAAGTLYHDAGNGFEYEAGDYVLHQFVSSKYHTDSLKIDITKTEGKMTVNRVYRIGYVTDDGIVYNSWSTDTVQYVKIISDVKTSIDLTVLKRMYVGGTFNNWTASSLPMKYLGENKWKADPVRIPAGKYDLKFTNTLDWSGNDWGNASGLTGTVKLTTGGYPNLSFTIPSDGNYVISFNDSTLAYSIVKSFDSNQFQMYVAGTFSNWDLSKNKMTLTDKFLWKSPAISMTAGTNELKFGNTPDWTGNDWGNATGLSGTLKLTTGGHPNLSFSVPATDDYVIWFNDSTLSYSIDKSYKSNQPQMYVAGTFSNWDLRKHRMTQIDDYTWESDTINLTPGNYELKFANTSNFTGDDWGNASGLTSTAQLTTGGYPNITFTIPTSKSYTILFNDNTLEYSIIGEIETGIETGNTSGITIYPNPISGITNIRSEKVIGRVEILDAIGSTFFKTRIDEKQSSIDLSFLNNGVYIIRLINNDNECYTQKILVDK